MSIVRTRTARIAAAAAGLVLALGGAGVAVASGTAPSPTPSAQAHRAAPARAARWRRRHPRRPLARLLGRLEHGEFVLKTRTGTETLDVQRGTVAAASPTSVSVTSLDGTTLSYVVGSASRVVGHKVNGGRPTIADVHAGDRVLVIAVKSGATDTVRTLFDPKA